jgi:hypothetical protein
MLMLAIVLPVNRRSSRTLEWVRRWVLATTSS